MSSTRPGLPARNQGRTGRASRLRLAPTHRRRHLPLWVELPLLLIVAFSAAVLLRTFAVQAFHIPSGSMENTLHEGDRVLVVKMVYEIRPPQRGEVVVFRGTNRWAPEYQPGGDSSLVGGISRGLADLIGIGSPDEKDFIKRVIGVPGDVVACCDEQGRVTVNGVSLDESEYLFDDAPLDVDPVRADCRSRRFGPVTVPDGQVFVMGDHRGNSRDSRCQGPVPIENLIGRAVSVVWPRDHWATLDIPDTFDAVPPPSTEYQVVDPAAEEPQEDSGLVLPIVLALLPPAKRLTARAAAIGSGRRDYRSAVLRIRNVDSLRDRRGEAHAGSRPGRRPRRTGRRRRRRPQSEENEETGKFLA